MMPLSDQRFVGRARGRCLPAVTGLTGMARAAGHPSAWLCAVALLTAGGFDADARAQSPSANASANPAASSAAVDNAGDLRDWLSRIRDAASHVNYAGTWVNSAGGSVISSRVVHYCEGRNEYERVDALDGEARDMLRVNDEVRTLWPRFRVAVVEPVDPRAAFPSLVSGSEKRIPDFYELQLQAPERLAGHDADRLLLKARDGDRFDHLVWTDHSTGLLLRVDVQAGGRTLESSAFSDVKVGIRPDPNAIYAELHRADGYRVVRPAMEATRLEAEGWTMQPGLMPAGFLSLGCVRRALPMPGTQAGEAKVLQTIFSDGLTHVSLFIEPFQAQRHKNPGLTVTGATHTLTRRVNDYWLTAVGDVPPASLDRFVRALERKP